MQRDPHLDTLQLNCQKPKRESWKRKMTSCTKNPLIRNRSGQKAVGGHTWWRDILLWTTYCFLSNWNGPRKKIYKPRILHPAKLVFKNKGEIKTFPDKQNLKKESVTSRSAVQEILKRVLQAEMKGHSKITQIHRKITGKGNYTGKHEHQNKCLFLCNFSPLI